MKKGCIIALIVVPVILVIGLIIVGILSATIFLAVNPGEQLARAKLARVSSDLHTVMNGVKIGTLDHDGALPNCEYLTSSALVATKVSDKPGVCELFLTRTKDATSPNYLYIYRPSSNCAIVSTASQLEDKSYHYVTSDTTGSTTLSSPTLPVCK